MVILRGLSHPNAPEYWTFNERYVPLRGRDQLAFSFIHEYILIQRGEGARNWRVSSRTYFYQVRRHPDSELIAFHWHPGRRGQPEFPHLHIDGARGSVTIARKNHVPTGRISLESVARFLIAELDVRPLRGDWEQVLDDGEQAFSSHRSW